MFFVGPKHYGGPLYMREDPEWPNVVLAMRMDGDPHWANTVLSMPMDGANDGTVFTDLKGNTVTRVGTPVTKTTNKAFGTASAYFVNSNDCLSLPTTTFLSSMGNVYTMEAWIYLESIGPYGSAVIGQSGNAGNQDQDFGVDGSGRLWFYQTYGMGTPGINLYGPSSLSLRTWHHVALVSTGTDVMLFQDGWMVASAPYTSGWASSANLPTIGRSLNGGYSQYVRYMTGFIDGLRITQGVARYTNHFELPMAPWPQGTSFIDEKGHTITVGGNTALSTTKSRTGGYSAYFDGSGDYLSIPDSDEWHFGAGDFTVECWFNIGATPSPYYFLAGQWNGPGFYGWELVANTTSVVFGYTADGSTDSYASVATTISLNTWYHVAFSRRGNVMYIGVNGQILGSPAITTTLANVSAPLYIGMNQNGGAWAINGHIDDLRITKGVGRYTTHFVPPERFSAHAETDPYFSNVVLGIHANGAAGSTVIPEVKGKTVTAFGNAALSATQARFGPTSLYFDGNVDGITIPYTTDFDFGAGNFTIEMWIYKTGNNVNGSRLWNANGDYYNHVDISIGDTGTLASYWSSTGNTWNVVAAPSIAAISNNVWTHIAVVRNGTNALAFVDGVMYTLSTGVGTTVLINGTGAGTSRSIGGQSGGVNRSFNGFIDDIRVTKGVARYTATFTPPRAPFPNW
jgi:Concanavalin A-like lectin/glucanases superfamily